MTVLPEARADLAAGLRQLIDGEITNDAFADRWYARYEECLDAAVAQIAEFGHGLSSDGLFAIRLSGRHALRHDVRRTADRAIAFLGTNQEYTWPAGSPFVARFWGLWGPGFYLLPTPILVWCAWWLSSWARFGSALAGLGLALPALHWLATRQQRRRMAQAFQTHGDVAAWPFRRQGEIS